MFNPRSRLNDAFFTYERVKQFLGSIKTRRIENPDAVVFLTNVEVWSLVRNIEFFEDRYVTNFGGTEEEREIIDGFKEFKETVVVPDGTENSHAVNLSQLIALGQNIENLLQQTLQDYATTQWVTQNFYPLNSNPAGYLTEETDPIFNSWLSTDPLSAFLTTETDPQFNSWLSTDPLSGFLTEETDPTVADHIKSITTTEKTNWNTAFSWGDHASVGYLTSFTETDPTVAAHIKSITTTEKDNWNTAFSWGNHALVGYLTSFTETDPTVASHIKSITVDEKDNWNTAFSWGNHAIAGYITETNANARFVRYDINNQGLNSTQRQNARTNILAVSTDTADLITGLKTIRRAGPNDGSAIANTLAWEIGTDDFYKFYISNTQNEVNMDGEVNWFFRMREIYTSGANEKGVTHDRIGFFKGGITVIGGRHPSSSVNTDILTWITANYVAGTPYPISTYIKRGVMVEGRGYFGKSNLDNTLFLTSDDTLFSEGTVYAAKGLRTADAENPTTIYNSSTLFFGNVVESAAGAHTHKLKLRHNNTVYNVLIEAT